jgi:integrase
MSTTDTFVKAAERYLCLRRKLGFALKIEGAQLLRFARYADSSEHIGSLTIELAVQWASQSTKSNSIGHARRLDIVRRFAAYLHLTDPETQIPPEGILGPSYGRLTPYIYSHEEISSLVVAARTLTPHGGLRPHTYATLFGLLACTGIRISEALNLSVENFDAEERRLIIIEGKFHKSRIVPLHQSAVDMLSTYDDLRRRKHPLSKTRHYFLTERGTSLKYLKVFAIFHRIAAALGWKTGITGRSPRIHDLRHSFAVNRLLQWYRDGEDIDRRIPELSTYLGHQCVANTYWYLTAIPELMAIAASLFEQFAHKEACHE